MNPDPNPRPRMVGWEWRVSLENGLTVKGWAATEKGARKALERARYDYGADLR